MDEKEEIPMKRIAAIFLLLTLAAVPALAQREREPITAPLDRAARVMKEILAVYAAAMDDGGGLTMMLGPARLTGYTLSGDSQTVLMHVVLNRDGNIVVVVRDDVYVSTLTPIEAEVNPHAGEFTATFYPKPSLLPDPWLKAIEVRVDEHPCWACQFLIRDENGGFKFPKGEAGLRDEASTILADVFAQALNLKSSRTFTWEP